MSDIKKPEGKGNEPERSLSSPIKNEEGLALAIESSGIGLWDWRVQTGEIHLLMTDVVMPEMNGRELYKELLAGYPHLKCLFMSGYTANIIAHNGVLDDGVEFIQKPFLKQDLVVKVRETLDKK
jgi:DNA-binding NtrC family response regulator